MFVFLLFFTLISLISTFFSFYNYFLFLFIYVLYLVFFSFQLTHFICFLLLHFFHKKEENKEIIIPFFSSLVPFSLPSHRHSNIFPSFPESFYTSHPFLSFPFPHTHKMFSHLFTNHKSFLFPHNTFSSFPKSFHTSCSLISFPFPHTNNIFLSFPRTCYT